MIVGVISLFIGGVLVIQTASNLENPFIDKMYVGYMVRESLILEFCSTMIALILAGKMGSNIASELGSMRITEQIDAMDMMGVNSASFLVLPKIAATTILSPLLMLMSLALGLVGGYFVVSTTGIISIASYMTGIKFCYNGFYIFYSCFKMSLFCFMISSISAYKGYFAKGGSLGVGRSSTSAIIVTSILILLMDLVVTQLMLY
jgi:phospholipid/cholesterol/gamma-HCH transport system permease protein